MRKIVIAFITLLFLFSLKGYSDTTKNKSLVVPQVLNETPMDTPVVSLSESITEPPSHNNSIMSSETLELIGIIISFFFGISSLAFSIFSIYKSSKVNMKANLLIQDVKRLEIKMRTSDLIVSKRLEVFPKLHILTDTLGAAIRYYNIHINDTNKRDWNTMVLKREIKTFHQKLCFWDANYCIYAGKKLTNNIGYVRKWLEKEDDLEKKELTKKILDDLYVGLLNIEYELKKEMKIHITESEEENISTEEKKITSIDY